MEQRRRLADGVASSLRRTGCCVVRDPRVGPQDNRRFLDTMEAYFAQPASAKLADARPELHYQVRHRCARPWCFAYDLHLMVPRQLSAVSQIYPRHSPGWNLAGLTLSKPFLTKDIVCTEQMLHN